MVFSPADVVRAGVQSLTSKRDGWPWKFDALEFKEGRWFYSNIVLGLLNCLLAAVHYIYIISYISYGLFYRKQKKHPSNIISGSRFISYYHVGKMY